MAIITELLQCSREVGSGNHTKCGRETEQLGLIKGLESGIPDGNQKSFDVFQTTSKTTGHFHH